MHLPQLRISPRHLRALPGALSLTSGPLYIQASSHDFAESLHPLIPHAELRLQEQQEHGHRLAITTSPASAGLRFPTPPTQAEGFSIRCDSSGVTIAATDTAGLRWGAQAAGEILAASGSSIPGFELSDWPELPMRGVMIDLSRTCVEKPEYIHSLIDFLADWRCNMLQLYFEERLTLRKHPGLAHPLGYSIDTVTGLHAHAQARGIELAPAFATFGHAQGYLQSPAYRHLADGDQIYQFDPLHPGTTDLLGDLFDDWATVTPSGWVNAGCDEAPYFGNSPRTREFIDQHGVPAFIAQHLTQLHEMLTQRGFRMMIWADMLHHYPATLDLIPRDIVLLEWNYDAIGEHTRKAIDLYQSKGFKVIAAPAASRSAQIGAPMGQQITRNIPQFAALANRMGLHGLLTCQWEAQPRNPRLSEPGYALALRLAWEGRRSVPPHLRQSVYSYVMGGNGQQIDEIMKALSPDRMMRRFRRIHRDPSKAKSYHLPNHELIATDPVLNLRPQGAAPWAKALCRQYETARTLIQQAREIEPRWLARLDFAAATGLFSAWKRTHINQAGRFFARSYHDWQAGHTEKALAQLQQSLPPLTQLISLCERLVRDAPAHWQQDRHECDPAFESVYGARFRQALAGARQLRDSVQQTLQAIPHDNTFPLQDYLNSRHALAFHSSQRPGTDVNIVSLKMSVPDPKAPNNWIFDRTVATFQPQDSRYDYIFIPPALPPRIRLQLTRSQAQWSLHHDLQLKIYQLQFFNENAPAANTLLTEDYHLIPHPTIIYTSLPKNSPDEITYTRQT